MPRKLRKTKQPRHRITPAAIEAWRAGNYMALHRALNLRPWEPSPLPSHIEPLGVDPDRRPARFTLWDESCEKALELQQELYRMAGEPGRGGHAA